MIYIFVQRLVVAFFTIVTLASCADYLTDNNNQTVNGKIGLPGSVNLLNTATNSQATKAINSISVPEITTRAAIGGGQPLFCRYTTVPGINKNKSEATSNVATRNSAITTKNFYNSYSLYSYIYPDIMDWNFTAQSSGAAFNETYFDEEVKAARAWTTSQFWPGEHGKCSFFAYAPYHTKGLSNFAINKWPSFHYSVPIEVTEQSDLLVTKNKVSAGKDDYGNIDVVGDFNRPDSITFDHACTAIRFAIGDQMAPGIIKKIRICNVYGSGDYNYETESWSNVDSLKTFALTQDFEIKPGERNKLLNNDDNIFMMIPQKIPLNAAIEITINDGTDHVIKAYIQNDQWIKGYTVTYYLSTAQVGSSYVLSMAPASGNMGCTGGTKAVTINSYKQTYYGTLTPVPWTASYTYDDADEIGTTIYNSSTAAVPSFTASGNGSTTGESTNIQVASQVARSKSWRSSHTQTLRNAADGSCNLAAGKQSANCYVIQAPGTYTFPLVYGNALNADGSSNISSYGTASFVDHNGVQIDNPYIYITNGGANVPYDACIVWQDAPSLITPSSVQLTSDKHSIQFAVERKNICAGNCVIAVRDKDKNIMWSWHIWLTDHSMTNTYEVHNNLSVGGSVISNFMEVPLGWCDDEVRVYDPRTFHITVKQTETGGQTATANIIQLTSDSTYTYGANAPYYQWGRKDPTLPGNGMGNIDKPYYDNTYVPSYLKTIVNIRTSIINPYICYSNESGNWSSSGSLEFWNKGNTSTDVNNNPVYKTIYDPTPSDYVMPKSAAFTGFTRAGSSSTTLSDFNVTTFSNGWNFYTLGWKTGPTIFFRALGYRTPFANGALVNFGTWGDYGSCGVNSSTNGVWLEFHATLVNTTMSTYRSYAFSICPVHI